MTERVILAHGHIFKNAGTTLDWSLERSFGEGFLDHRDNEPMLQQGAAYLGPFLEAHPKLKAISSHHLCFPLPELPGCRIPTVYLLRHPVERIFSVYSFERKQIADTPGAVNAKKMDLREYVHWRLERSQTATIHNFQTRYLCGIHHHNRLSVTESDYAVAFQNLTRKGIVGVVERYNESMVMFEHRLRDALPEIDLSYVRQNTNFRIERLSHEARIKRIRRQLGEDLYERVVAANRYDFALHQLAGSELDRFIAGQPTFLDALSEFEDRCRKLAGVEVARRLRRRFSFLRR